MSNANIEAIRTAIQEGDTATALTFLARLEVEVMPRMAREVARARELSAALWDDLLLHWQDVDELREGDVQPLTEQYIRFHHQHMKLLGGLADRLLGGISDV